MMCSFFFEIDKVNLDNYVFAPIESVVARSYIYIDIY